MSSSDDLFYLNPRRTIAVWCWAQVDATMGGVTQLVFLLSTRNLWNAGVPSQLQGSGPGFHRGGGSLFFERLWLYHAAVILNLEHDFSDPWLVLDEGHQPGQVWPGVLRLLRSFFFPEQPTRSPVPSRRRAAAPTQPIFIMTLPTITEVSSDEELFEYSPTITDDSSDEELFEYSPKWTDESEVSESERVEEDVEEEADELIFMSVSPHHSPRPEIMAIADEDLHGSVLLPVTPKLHSTHEIVVSFDEELPRPISPPRANPVMIVTFPDDDDHFAPIPPVETGEVVDEVDHFPPLPPVVITEIVDDEELFPPLPPVTVTEILLDADLA